MRYAALVALLCFGRCARALRNLTVAVIVRSPLLFLEKKAFFFSFSDD